MKKEKREKHLGIHIILEGKYGFCMKCGHYLTSIDKVKRTHDEGS